MLFGRGGNHDDYLVSCLGALCELEFPRFLSLIHSSGCSESTRPETGNVYLCEV